MISYNMLINIDFVADILLNKHIISLIDKITKAVNSNDIVISVFIDFYVDSKWKLKTHSNRDIRQ